jgi:predicted nucleic acid-binding protein
VSLLVDTSVWSLAFRRDAPLDEPEVVALRTALVGGQQVFTTGLVLQELLQGVVGPRAKDQLLERFAALGFLQPDRQDHIDAAEVRNACRRKGVQLGTIDALLVQLARRHELTLLSTDRDFLAASAHVGFELWASSGR